MVTRRDTPLKQEIIIHEYLNLIYSIEKTECSVQPTRTR